MTGLEARTSLEVSQTAEVSEIREAYLRLAPSVHLGRDPGRYLRLRGAYETLAKGGEAGPIEEVTAARELVATNPDDAGARWRLLSSLPYAATPEAGQLLVEGAERNPDEARPKGERSHGKCRFANARPEPVFRYRSTNRATRCTRQLRSEPGRRRHPAPLRYQ